MAIQYVINNNNTLTLKGDTSSIANTPITFDFYYDKRSQTSDDTPNIEMVVKSVNVSSAVGSGLQITVPVPFADFYENGWLSYVSSNGKFIPYSSYNVDGDKFTFNNIDDYNKYSTLEFHFMYTSDTEYIHEVETEDIEKDFELSFVAAPLSEDDWYHNNHIMTLEHSKLYDNMIIEDPFWHGVDSNVSQDTIYNEVKSDILKKEFNYEASKFFGLSKVYDIAEASFQLAYFYSMLFDDVEIERLLNVKVNKISNDGTFNIAHVFCYLIALSYLYQDIDDTIMNTPTKIMYVKGFNFKADVEALRQDILDQYKDPDDYPIWEWMNPSPSQIPDMDTFNKIYNKNKEIFEIVTEGMFNARNHDIYKVWKKIYDSLMIWKFNMDYFKLDNGEQAATYTDFLEEKSPVLYKSIMKYKENKDIESRNNAILEQIIDVVFILQQYLTMATTNHIFRDFPGVSEEAILGYIYTLLDFFKSYKIVLAPKTVLAKFGTACGGRWLNSVRPTDDKIIDSRLPRYSYIYLEENTSTYNYKFLDDNIGIKETLSISTSSDITDTLVPIHIKQMESQTITVYNEGKAYTSDFLAPYGTDFYCDIEAEAGFTPGVLNIKQGVATEETTVFATTSSGKILNITIIQSDHQTIEVMYTDNNGKTAVATESFAINYGKQIYVTVRPDTGYSAGTPNITSATVTYDLTIRASAAYTTTYTVQVMPTDNQTLTFIADNRKVKEGGTGRFEYGTDYQVTLEADDDIIYKPGTINVPEYGTITSNMVIEATDATYITYTVTIIQPSNSTLKVTIIDSSGKTTVYTTDTIITVGANSIYRAEIIPDDLYKPGALECESSGSITSDMTISATDAEKYEDLTIWIIQSLNQEITVFINGTGYNTEEGIKIPYKGSYTATVTPDDGYEAGALINGSGTNITEDVIVSATEATQKRVIVYITQSDHQTITVTCNGYDYTETFDAPYGSSWSARIEADDGYEAGTLNTASSGTLSSDFTISASEAIKTEKELLAAIIDKSIEGNYYNDKITKLRGTAFYMCKSLTTIDLPNVTSINGGAAFEYCKSLTSVNLPKVTKIGNATFAACTSLTTVNISKLTNTMGAAFSDCTSLTTIDLPNATSIGYIEFKDCTSLTTVNLPNATSIDYEAFENCTSLTTIDLPNVTSISNIGNGVFSGCSKLTAIHFSASNKSKIVALDGYSNKFGATNATIYFDL